MLAILGGCLAFSVVVTGLAIVLLVVQVERRQLIFQNADPAIDHDLPVVERTDFLRSFYRSVPTENFAHWAPLEDRHSHCRSALLLGLARNSV